MPPFLVLPFPAFDPVLISFGPFAIRWYALAYIAGILLGWLYARAIVRNEKLWNGRAPLTVLDFDDFVLWVTLGIILGGRIGYVLFYNLPHYAAYPLEALQLWHGGMSFHGGFLGCVLAVILFAKRRGIPVLTLGDITCAVGPIGLFFGRIANFVNGELWGRPTDVPWAMVFPHGGPLPRHPSQLYEAGMEGLLLLLLLAAVVRAGGLKRPGLIIGVFALGYGIARCTGEFFREPDVQLGFLWGGLTMGMLLSLPMMLAGGAFIAYALRGDRAPRLAAESGSLGQELRHIIESDGPIPVGRYMTLCLSHPRYGYYMGRDPFGRGGDFVTAPEISQMFGELLGLWAATVWSRMGSPERILLAELGPGRGTLMADALRVAKTVPAFRGALAVHLVETSPALRQRQEETLAAARNEGVPITWHQNLAEIPDEPLIVIANEFFDALPVDQAVKQADGWHLRAVGLDADGALAFGLQPAPMPALKAMLPVHLRNAPPGAVYEWRSDTVAVELSRRLAARGGAALVIDYGHAESGLGNTLQAVRNHAFADPLKDPGEADLTAHVDFAALGSTAIRHDARVYGPVTMAQFLRSLGIEARAAKLKEAASAEQAAAVDAALARLTGSGEHEMGTLFKVMVLTAPNLVVPPGFDT
jgi:phosphatidylglycerol:prolipoprotein diacylglycerol transferase